MKSEAIVVAGGLNFRSVSAYPAAGGRVKALTIYRSGAFEGVGDSGAEAMRRLHVRTAFDLRSTREKERSPSPLLLLEDFTVVSEEHSIRHGDLYTLLASPGATAQACAAIMQDIYASLPADFASIYRRYFQTMVASETPVVVNCAAGKDRTGVAIAMLLDLLGVARADIMEDYLKTNASRDALYRRLLERSHGVDYDAVPEQLVQPMITANASYLNAMFEVIARDYGSMSSYAEQALHLSHSDIETLRRRLVE